MEKALYFGEKPLVLAVTIQAVSKIELSMKLSDSDIWYGNYINRNIILSGEKTFYIRMPESPLIGILKIENVHSHNDAGFKVVKLKVLPLDPHPEFYDSKDPMIKSFMTFIQGWAKRAKYLAAGNKVQVIPNSFFDEKTNTWQPGYFTLPKTYYSNDKRFRIDYVFECVNRVTGQVSTTPMRISEDRGIIEAAQKHVKPASIPEIIAWSTHEFSHFFKNVNSSDEEEADWNGAKIFLGYGYSVADLLEGFRAVFEKRDNPQNRARWEKFVKMAMDFDLKYNKYR